MLGALGMKVTTRKGPCPSPPRCPVACSPTNAYFLACVLLQRRKSTAAHSCSVRKGSRRWEEVKQSRNHANTPSSNVNTPSLIIIITPPVSRETRGAARPVRTLTVVVPPRCRRP